MKQSRSLNPLNLLLVILCALTLTLFAYPTVTTSEAQRSAVEAVTEAWERARQAGSYRYTADIVQKTIPKPTITNVGRTSRQEELYLEGETSLPDQTMHMHLWSGSGSVQDTDSGVEVRVTGDRAFARQGDSPWEEINDFTGLFAPQGDFMAYLSAARDITNQGTAELTIDNSQLTIEYTRYTFRVDGLGYASYMREQIQKHQAEKGELPPGVNLDLPRQYVDMEGEGELWIGPDGLPLRQIVYLTLPERPDVQIQAEIVVDFFDFGYAQQGAGYSPRSGAEGEGKRQEAGGRRQGIGNGKLGAILPDLQTLNHAALTAFVMALVVVIIAHRRSRKLYVALVLALIVSMVATPLLRSVQAANYARRQAQRAHEQEQRQKENEMMRSLRNFRVTQATSDRLHHPNISPLNPTSLANMRSLGISASDESFNCQDDDRTDLDQDGLTDCQETFLGTATDNVDSDHDTLSDKEEVQGFDYNGQTWYTDPLESDTNQDGIGDRREWTPSDWDTDDDGTPDLFDRDNDDDGVPDHIDLSPFSKKGDVTQGDTAFGNYNPLLLQLNDLEKDLPTYVEFQLRPTDPDRLWYAMNVLDWPQYDLQANIQDADGKTFYDVDPQSPLSPNDNGDLKLVPMLEIRISGSRTNLPPQDELDHYGIFVLDMNKDGSGKVAYVPLQVITDDDDDGRARARVAFAGKMLYRPEDSWGNAQQVRLVWLVQALVDVCKEGHSKDGECTLHDPYNQVQVIHAYYDQWTLTGFSVREDHGVDVALIYDDPAVDSDLHDDAPLVGLAHGLDHSFLAGRDADGVNGRDVTVGEIYRRFNHTTNAAVSDEERWGIISTLSVEPHTYEHLDEALATIPMTDTKELLERVFSPHWSESSPITPTLMLVREERYRIVNLDDYKHSQAIAWNGSQLNVDLPTSGDYGVPVQVLAGVNWAPYRFRASWEACPMDVYWDELARRDPFASTEDPDEAAGMLFVLQLYYLGLYRGVSYVVQSGDVVIETEAARLDSTLNLGGKVGAAVLKHVFTSMLNPILEKTPGFWSIVGNLVGYGTLRKVFWDLPSKIAGVLKSIPKWLVWGVVGFVVITIVILAVAALVTLAYLGWIKGHVWAQVTVMVAYQVTLAAILIITTLTTTVSAVTVWGYAIGLILNVMAIWIIFLIQAARENLQPGSIEFKMLLAYAIAATVLAIFLFLIFVVFAVINVMLGAIVVIIIGLLIGLADAIGLIWGFSLTDWLTRQVAGVLYHVDPLVDLDVDVAAPALSLENPERGLTDANRMKFATSVTTNIRTKRPPWHQREISEAENIYRNYGYFISSAFNYRLDRNVGEPDNPVPAIGYPVVESGDTSWIYLGTEWDLEWGDHRHKARTTQDVSLYRYIQPKAGVNSHIPLLLALSYELPGIECITSLYCDYKSFEGSHAIDMNLAYDILPGSLGGYHGFYDLEATTYPDGYPDGGYRLAWDDAFEPLKDADGDGLLSVVHGGLDPDDSDWDSDDDGLSDAYELQVREDGIDVSATSADTDGDGLLDADELRLGTDPGLSDSDRDGLTDDQEVFHQALDGSWTGGWEIVYGFDTSQQPLRIRVTADPTLADTDGDGMSDLTEKVLAEVPQGEYAFHPRVPNPSPIALYAAMGDADGIVAPGSTVPYTASVHNNLVVPLYSAGELRIEFPAILDKGTIVTDFMLFMGQAITITTDMIVPPGSASQQVLLENTMDSQLTSNPSCAKVYFEELYCQTEADDSNNPGPEDYHPPGSEISIFLRQDGSTLAQIWEGETGITSGNTYSVDKIEDFCGQATVEIWECDWYLFGCSPTTLEMWTIDVQSRGDHVHPVDDYSDDFIGSLAYSVYYASGAINLEDIIALTIDADPPSTSTLTSLSDGQHIQGTAETLIIGGIASDLVSGIAKVEISVDGGAWEEASGAESWAYAWQIPDTVGVYTHTFRTRATDKVGHVFTETADTTVIVDIYPPDVSTSIQNGAFVAATLDTDGQWNVPLYGTVEDLLDSGGPPGSGVRSVEVLLEGVDDVAGRGWQTATLTAPAGNTWMWQLDYVFPSLNNDEEVLTDPSGEYNFVVRAIDNVGNVTHSPLGILLRVDNTPPLASVTDTGPDSELITQSLTISGVITDPGNVARGLASLEIAYTLVGITDTLSPELLDWQPATLADSGAGVTRTTWSHVIPTSLPEGVYQIALRGTDVLSNRNDMIDTWSQWQGEIDVLDPRVNVEFRLAGLATDETARTEYSCQVEDFNLVEGDFQCPCPVLPGDRHMYDADWYRLWVSNTARLYSIQTSCLVLGHQPASSAYVRACDRYGHCDEDSVATASPITSPLDSVIFTPTYGTLLTTTSPISIAGGAYASRADGLKALTVTIDSDIIYTQTWAPGASYGEIWSTTWLTPTEGPHRLVSVAADHYVVQTDTRPITIVVDTLAPEIALPTSVLTTAQRLPGGQVLLTGPYTETGGVASIQVRQEGGQWGDAAPSSSQTWRYAWPLGEEPDGVPYTLTARIVDVVGRTALQTGTVSVDLVPPELVSVTLAYTNQLGVRSEITPGQTIRDVLSPTLLIEWTASSDGSGLSGYLAGWSTSQAPDPGELTSYGLAAVRSHAQLAGEAQAYYAHVVAQDANANRQWQTLGPIYTDVPTTSDYIANLDYHGWMESGCSQIGADRELARYAQTGQALTGTQRLYMTWNTEALRLAWTGANWGNDGDLFIYFDTTPGGTSAAYNPYNATTPIALPAQAGSQLEADYLVWLEDASTATLLEWDGSRWLDAVTDTLSALPYYQLDLTLRPAHTDLYLPLSWLGLTPTSSLRLVALASEEDDLRLWAAMPDKNPLNSERAINTLAEVGQIANGLGYTLSQHYEWAALGPGVCPNAGQFTDADLIVDLSAEPPGVEVGYLEHDLLHLIPGQPLDGDLDGELDVALPLDTDPGLVGQGMVVTYTVHYANDGTQIAPGMHLTVTARGAAQLASDPLVIDLGDVGPGVTATHQFTAVVDASTYTTSGEVNAVVADTTHGAFDWLWVQHDIDAAAPEEVQIAAPLAFIRPYTNTVRGTVRDASDVPAISLESRLLPYGLVSAVDCTDATPGDGHWSCAWNVGEAYNGDQFKLRALGTDRFGNGPTADDWITLTVDTLTPTISLDAISESALQDAVLGPGERILLSGRVEDDQQAHSAKICLELASGPSCSQIAVSPGTAITGTWRYALEAVGEFDYEDQTLSLYGVDGAGNRSSQPLSHTYKVDTIAPVVAVTARINFLPSMAPAVVLSGTVSDGSGSSDVYVLVEAPGEPLTSTLAARNGDNWSYTLHPEIKGSYALRIEARDAKGNASGYGPYNVLVGGKKIYLPLVLKNH